MYTDIPGISIDANKNISEVLENSSWVEKAILYGSRAKGNYKTGSDIDISLHSSEKIETITFNRLEIALDDLSLPWHIDLSLYSSIDNESLKEHIDRVGLIIFQR